MFLEFFNYLHHYVDPWEIFNIYEQFKTNGFHLVFLTFDQKTQNLPNLKASFFFLFTRKTMM